MVIHILRLNEQPEHHIKSWHSSFDMAQRYLEERHFTELRYKMMWRCISWLYDNDHEITGDNHRKQHDGYARFYGQVAIDLLL